MRRMHKKVAALFVLLCVFSSLRFSAPILNLWLKSSDVVEFEGVRLEKSGPQAPVITTVSKFIRRALYSKDCFFVFSFFCLILFLTVRRLAAVSHIFCVIDTVRIAAPRSPPAIPL